MSRPWRNRLVSKFFLSYLGIVLLLFLAFFLYSATAVKQFYISSLAKKLEREATLLGRLLPFQLHGPPLDAICRELAADLGVRITVIAPDGTALGDSDEPSTTLDNHGTRPEVVQALSRGAGSSTRYSTTVGYEMLYHAVLQENGGRRRIVRLSVPLAEIEEVVGKLRWTIFLGLVLASSLGLIPAFLFSRRLGRRVTQMAEFSRAVAQGSYPQNFFLQKGEDELSLLEHNLNEMSLKIREKIKEITAEREKVGSILRCMIEGLLVVDTRGRVLLLNEQAQAMFHVSPGRDVHGVSIMEISRHPEMKRLVEEVFACDCTRECFSKEISLNEGQWFQVNAVSLRDGDERSLGYILVFHDITDLKRLETVRADFVANVSHELRTPLTAIRGYVETLRRTPPPDREDAEHFLEIIERHTERLARLTDDLLTLSDLESGRARLAKEPLEVSDLFQRVLEVFQDRASKKGVELSRTIDPGLPPLLGDPDRLQQLLINLVDNAIKYTSEGGRVTVTANPTTLPGSMESSAVEIAVIDTGCGIPATDLPRLTERFYRVDKARSRELGGTGLGLAIVKYILQAHGGQLNIESQPQMGTTVRVFLPAIPLEIQFKGVLFLCTANSCRSQMAEAFARALAPQGMNVYSAGTSPNRVHPLAIKVMEEVGIDLSRQRSKGIEEIPREKIDLVVTLCGEAAESCPTLPPNTRHLHWSLPDPTSARGDEREVLEAFRKVRDEIRTRVEKLFSLNP